MAHLSPTLARRVDRLARRAHAFHRWAHHPLCERYAGETVRLGRRARLCRGCLLALAGAAAGLLAGLAGPVHPAVGLGAAAAAAVGIAWTTRRVPAAGGGRRAPKLVTRSLPAAAAALALAQARSGAPSALLGAAFALAAAVAGLRHYRRRGPDRRACQGCPDAPPGATCAGFVRLVSRERALQRLAGRWIAAEQRAASPADRGGPSGAPR